MNLIDPRLVATQILGFLILVWALRQWAFGPLQRALEARRQKIADEFKAAERAQAEAADLKARYDQELKGIEARARQRIQEAVTEGQKVAGEIRTQAQQEAQRRLEHATEEIAREREKAKELVKEQIIQLAVRSAEKILRTQLDAAAQRKLVATFIDEVGASR